MKIGLLPEGRRDQSAAIWKQRHSLLPAIYQICQLHGIAISSPHFYDSGSNVVVKVTDDQIVKLYFPFLRHQFACEAAVLKRIYRKLPVQTPKLYHSGEIENWPYIIMGMVKGVSLSQVWKTLKPSNRLLLMGDLGRTMQALHQVPVSDLNLTQEWPDFLSYQLKNAGIHHHKQELPQSLLAELPSFLPASIEQIWKDGELAIVTGDFTPEHLLLTQQAGHWKLSGLIDFADSMIGQPEYDLTGPLCFITQGDQALIREFLTAYGYSHHQLDSKLSKKLLWLTLLHRFSNLKAQIPMDQWEQKLKSFVEIEAFLCNFSA